MKLPSTPWWFTLLTIAVALVAAFLAPGAVELAAADEAIRPGAGWFLPLYLVLSCVLAWYCYPERREIAWILVGLMAVTSLFSLIIDLQL